MSKVSEISSQYHDSLEHSQNQYEDLYKQRVNSTEDFYNKFFKDLTISFEERFQNENVRRGIQEILRRHTGTNTLSFIAVDGTCQKEQFSDMITFYGGAYGAKGEIDLLSGKHTIRYKRWSLDQDVSMVAWLPIPFAKLDEIASSREDFVTTEEEKINTSSIHTQIMQLAEVFLSYNTIQSSRLDAPHILLMDLSPSSVLASHAHAQENIGLVGYHYDVRALTKGDISIALAHPFSDDFSIPSSMKVMDRDNSIIHYLSKKPNDLINLDELKTILGINEVKLINILKDYFINRVGILEEVGDKQFRAKINVNESWGYTKNFFQNICTKLFIQKDQTALQYDAIDDDGKIYKRWLSPDDISFLISVGMKMLIELCWERNVLYYGVVKDSSSKYLTRNYLGVTLQTGFYPELATMDINKLPWTDRIFCETLPLIDSNLNAPWATVEFDSAFMLLHRQKNIETNEFSVAGFRRTIVNQEKLFAKSLAQFFLKRKKATPLMGHVVFLERLFIPKWDKPNNDKGSKEIEINTQDLGQFNVFAWKDKNQENIGQLIMMYLLSVLAKNHYAEAIGYPDPLHKADQGAKTVGKSVAKIVKSSTHFFASRPLSKTFREIRDSKKR